MIIRSLVNYGGSLLPVEVEIELTPGLPQMHFLGLADQGIKESIYRIRCAIRQQGFKYPRNQQILVNLRPGYFRKSSRGLELAVALGLLLKTGQVQLQLHQQNQPIELIAYGELSLSGEVKEPEDLQMYQPGRGELCLTGVGGAPRKWESLEIANLREIAAPRLIPGVGLNTQWQRPTSYSEFCWNQEQARWLCLMAAGGHHGLMAGASGIGKSTLAKALSSLLPEPTETWANEYQKHFSLPSWLPQIEPHHTISSQGLLGGGVPMNPGEITRAHGGVLILDELLEFNPSSLEALREPIEEGVIRLRKRNICANYPAEFQLVATTNLCPCGEWIPGKKRHCHYSKIQCMSNLRRVTGPFLDRFQIVALVGKKTVNGSKKVSTQQLQKQLEPVYAFQQSQYRVGPNSRQPESAIALADGLASMHGLNELSPRRRLSTLRVARTIADLEFQEELRSHHLEEARQWSILPFQAIKQGSC